MKRSPLRRTAGDPHYAAWRLTYLDGVMCERCTAHDGPRRPATEVHHRRFRSAGGHLTLPANCARLCSGCHAWVHAHPIEAHEAGWIVRQGDLEWHDLAARPDRSAP